MPQPVDDQGDAGLGGADRDHIVGVGGEDHIGPLAIAGAQRQVVVGLDERPGGELRREVRLSAKRSSPDSGAVQSGWSTRIGVKPVAARPEARSWVPAPIGQKAP